MKTKMSICLLAILLLLAGCSGGSAPDLDPAEAAKSLVDTLEFQDSLLLMDGGAAEDFYMLDETVADYAIYVSGTGAKAEEVAVLKVGDAQDMDHVRAILERRVEDLIFRYEDYRPDEMQKLNSPVIETVGNAVILVLSDDNAAAEQAIADLKK